MNENHLEKPAGELVGKTMYENHLSVVGAVEHTPSGNVVLRIGRKVAPELGWMQSEHIVLTPEEAVRLGKLLVRLGDDVIGQRWIDATSGSSSAAEVMEREG